MSTHPLSPLEFVAEIDRMIDAKEPSTHLWNYCVWNRKEVLRGMVKHDTSTRKVLAHHELYSGRVAANTEDILNDLMSCDELAALKLREKALVEALRSALHKVGVAQGKLATERTEASAQCANHLFYVMRDLNSALAQTTEATK